MVLEKIYLVVEIISNSMVSSNKNVLKSWFCHEIASWGLKSFYVLFFPHSIRNV